MQVAKYHKLREELIEDAFEVSNKKGQDYTRKSEDALKNFKSVAKRTGMTPKQVLGVYMMKHWDAISSFIEHDGQLESEPIKERIVDSINYLCLLWGLIKEEEESLSEEQKDSVKKEWKEVDNYSSSHLSREIKEYEFLEDIEGLAEKGSILAIPADTNTWEYVHNKTLHQVRPEEDERLKKLEKGYWIPNE